MRKILSLWQGEAAVTLASTVGSPSVHRRGTTLKHLALMLLFLLGSIGQVWAEDVIAYTLEPASTGGNSSPHNSYAAAATTTISDIEWSVMGNSSNTPWRIGGKKITNEVRPIFSKTAISDNITKVVVTHGESSLTSVSVVLKVYSTADDAASGSADNLVSTVNGGDLESNAEITFSRPANDDWTGCFYRFEYTCTYTSNSNKNIAFVKAEFYKSSGTTPPDPGCTNKVTVSKGTGTFDLDKTGELNCCEALVVTLSNISAPSGKEFDAITQSGIDAEKVTIDQTSKTVTYAANTTGESTINVTYKDIPTYQVTWSANGITSNQNYAKGAPITFPTEASGCDGKEFVGWVATPIIGEIDEEPTFVTSATMGDADLIYYAVFALKEGDMATKTYGFEDTDDASYWTIDGPAKTEWANASGKYAGKINTNKTYITFNNKVKVTNFSFKFGRTSTNSNYSVAIETSTDNSTWTAAETYTMGSFSNGSLDPKSKDFNGETELYVRFYCSNTTAVRYVDDISITYGNVSYSKYATTCTTPTCEKLGTPVVSVPAEYLTYNSAKLTWEAVENADKYVVKFNGVDQDATSNTYFEATGLTAETQYSYQVKALAEEGQDDYCDGVFSTSANFTTAEMPAAVLVLSENGVSRNLPGTHHLNDVISLPTEVVTGMDDKTLVGWSSVTIETPTDTKPTENFFAPGASYTLSAETQTLYAVYASGEDGDEVWNLATSVEAGDVIVFSSNPAYDGDMKTAGGFGGNTYLAVTSSTYNQDKTQITVLSSDAIQFTIGGNATDGWTLANGGQYLYMSGDKKIALKDEATTWSISFDGNIASVSQDYSSSTYTMYHNTQANRFNCYTSKGNTNIEVSLYKNVVIADTRSGYTTKGCEKRTIAIASGIENGSVEADLAEACEGATVTLTFTPAGSYHLESWSVNGTEQDVAKNTFTMPATAVTISATFVHDACANLDAPVLSSEIAKTYNSATIAWNELTGAISYVVSVVKNGEAEPIFSGSVTESSKALENLEPETQYDYTIMAVGDGTDYCAEGNPALEGSFTTAALPEVKLTLMVGGVEDDRSANHTILTPFNLPSTASVDNCPKVFVGWSADADRTTAPEYAPGAEFTFADETPATLYAVFAKASEDVANYAINFDSEFSSFTDWTVTTIAQKASNNDLTARSGGYFGTTDGKESGVIRTKTKIANPASITFYVSKLSTNNTASSWLIEVSSDETNWEQVGDAQSASSGITKGTWTEVTRNLSSYSDVYVRVRYSGTTAARAIDDVNIVASATSYSEYGTECEACKVVTLAKSGEDQKGNTFALKVGDDVVTSVQTCEAASVTIVPTVATGYEVSFGISELEGASLSENTISLAANAEGELTVTATYSQINYSVTMAQVGGANATLSEDQSNKHYGDQISISTTIPDGYQFTGWTPAELFADAEAAAAASTSFTMPNNDVTVTANFAKKYTVTFNVGEVTSLTEESVGAGVTLPEGPAPSAACVTAGWAFAGWAEAAIADETTDAQTLLNGEYHPTKDITLYAVYSRTEGGEVAFSKYEKVISEPTDWSGKYLLVANDGMTDYTFTGKSPSATTSGVSVELTPGTTELANYEVEVAATANGHSIYHTNGSLYLGLTSDGNNLNFNANFTASQYEWTISAENGAQSVSYPARYIECNTSSSNKVACYKATQVRFYFYKRVETGGSTTYYWSAPECCTPHNVTIADNIEHGTVVANPTSACADATITVTLTPAEGYELTAWTVDGTEQALNATTFTMPNKAVEVSATFSEIVTPAADATLKLMENGHEVVFEGNHKVGDVVTLPSELDKAEYACKGKVLKGWSTVEITTPVAAKPTGESYYELGASYAIASEEDVLYAVFAEEGAGAETIVQDVLTRATTGVTGTNYDSWSGKTAISSAVYAGSTAGGNESIQMRSNKSADGLVTTATGGNARKVTVTWNSNTASGRTIDIYGKSTAYTAATDLYATATQGTKLGSIICGTSTELTIDADYEYIGIRSASGALYLTDITIDWGTAGDVTYSNYATSCVAPLANPTFSVAGGEYNEAQTIELSAEEGTIYYTLNGATPTSASTEYTEPIVLNDCGTTTIKAIAISATNHSEVVSATYTINIPLPENSELIPYAPAEAIAVFDGHCYSSELVYVKGVVKTSSGLNTQYGNYDNIVVVAAETTAPEFTFYHMYKGANKEHFDANDPVIAAGDTIVAYGELTKYNAIYEFKDGCYLIDRKAYNVPKQSIVNDLAGAYTLADAINFLDNAAIYDLSEEVYVKGVATTAPNSYNTFTAHDPEAENVFQFYNTNLNELTVGVNDTIIVKGLIKKVNANYRMDAGVVQEVKAYVAPVVPEFTVDPTAVAFGNVEQNASVDAIELNVELTAIASATVTLADENGVFSIDKTALTETGVVTVSVASTATVGNYAATITLHDVAEAAEDVVVNVTMNVTEVETRNIANGSAFTAISGDLDPADIKFAAFKGDGTTNPVINNSNIRLYKPDANNNKTTGGYLKLTALMGCTIDQVEITFKGNATASYAVNDAEFSTEAYITDATSLLTPAELNATSVSIVNLKNGSIDISAIKVYYIGSPLAVHHYILGGTFETTFEQNTEFSYEGLTVTAAYDELETITEPITDFTVVADLSEAGQTTASVRRNDVEIATYEITVTPGKANPNLAYMPAEQIVAAVEVGAWVAPELSNTLNVAPITYSTNKAAVATVDENGVIALTGGYGTAVITAHFEGDENYIASEATYTITITEPVNKIAGKWMVAGAEDIKPGVKVIVVGEKSGTKYAMGTQNTNNRAAVAAQSIVNDTLYAAEGTKTFILVDAGEGLYAFQANNGMYLYAASNSSNQMKEQATLNDNGKWSIAIANDGEATIQAQGSNSRNLMSMTPNGNNNPLFSCYNSKQSAIKLYVNRNQIDGSDDPANPAEVAINDNVVEDEIVANGNVVVTVNTDNIEEPKSYIAQNGATIIITGTNPVAKNVVVEDGSRIEASVPTTTPTVYFATTMGTTQVPGTASELGSVTNITLATGGEIIYDLTLGTSMAGIQADPNQWHAFTLPFAVDALNGIYDAETGAKLQNEVNYAIMDYHGDIRANGQYGWKKYRGILQPGVFYLMTVDGNTKTFRFKASKVGAMTQTTSMGYTAYNGSGASSDYGWNGIGNPSWISATVEVNVQVLDPYTYTYQTLTSGTNLTVSTPFFYNAGDSGAEGSIVMQEAGTGANYAPARTPANEIKNVAVTFGNEVFRDKLYISASEDALNEYEQDKDLVRMIMSNTPKVAQIFGNAYGMKLSMVNAPMTNDQAEYSLTLYAPSAGEYSIAVPEMENADIYLTYEGSIIWNLSMGAYTNDFAKGNNEGYGLILVKKAPQVSTGVDNAEVNEAGVQKVIINDHVYILRDEQMYDVTGKMVK